MVTDPHTHTHKHTHRQDRLQYTVPQLASTQCNDTNIACYHRGNNTKRCAHWPNILWTHIKNFHLLFLMVKYEQNYVPFSTTFPGFCRKNLLQDFAHLELLNFKSKNFSGLSRVCMNPKKCIEIYSPPEKINSRNVPTGEMKSLGECVGRIWEDDHHSKL